MSSHYHIEIAKNEKGRDFVVGDIHGHMDLLISALEKVGFNRQLDRLFGLGDLVDRGPDSKRCLELINEPWFFSIRGNHEQLIANYMESQGIAKSNAIELQRRNGGKWFQKLAHSNQIKLYELIQEMPYAITLETEIGEIGLVHAEVPYEFSSWSGIVSLLDGTSDYENYDVEAFKEEMLWGRTAITEFYNTVELEEFRMDEQRLRDVKDIDLVVHGHTNVHQPVFWGQSSLD